jgi:hypothetical protein
MGHRLLVGSAHPIKEGAMSRHDYSDSHYPVRPDIELTHQDLFAALARPGTWWTGEERLAIAAEARAARDCDLCAERKAALSPSSVEGDHAGPGTLAPEVVDVIHRIVTDPGRLSKGWYDGVVSDGVLDDVRYVELIGVTVTLNALDVFEQALGRDPVALPEAVRGEPSRVRPTSARVEGAWVPQLGPDGGAEWEALYGGRDWVPQIGRALSLVPQQVRALLGISKAHYMELSNVGDPKYTEPDRTLDRLQQELIASRVSAINECFY